MLLRVFVCILVFDEVRAEGTRMRLALSHSGRSNSRAVYEVGHASMCDVASLFVQSCHIFIF